MGKCAIFIDGGYLSKLLQNDFGGAHLDYQRLSDSLADSHDRLRTYYL